MHILRIIWALYGIILIEPINCLSGMKKIYAIYQCSRLDFIKAAKKGIKLSSMPFYVNAIIVFCVTEKDVAFNDCVKWNSGDGKRFLTINWFVETELYK